MTLSAVGLMICGLSGLEEVQEGEVKGQIRVGRPYRWWVVYALGKNVALL